MSTVTKMNSWWRVLICRFWIKSILKLDISKNYQSICKYQHQEHRAFRNILGLVLTDTSLTIRASLSLCWCLMSCPCLSYHPCSDHQTLDISVAESLTLTPIISSSFQHFLTFSSRPLYFVCLHWTTLHERMDLCLSCYRLISHAVLRNVHDGCFVFVNTH